MVMMFIYLTKGIWGDIVDMYVYIYMPLNMKVTPETPDGVSETQSILPLICQHVSKYYLSHLFKYCCIALIFPFVDGRVSK